MKKSAFTFIVFFILSILSIQIHGFLPALLSAVPSIISGITSLFGKKDSPPPPPPPPPPPAPVAPPSTMMPSCPSQFSPNMGGYQPPPPQSSFLSGGFMQGVQNLIPNGMPFPPVVN